MEYKKIRKWLIEDHLRRVDFILMTDWLCSSANKKFDPPSIHLMGTQWRQTIYDMAVKKAGRATQSLIEKYNVV
jgi:hypothetical protein